MTSPDSRLDRCRKDFPALSRVLGGQPLAYFDGPGGTQVPRPVIEAISGYYACGSANTHGQFVTSEETDALIQEARVAAAALLGAADWRSISFGANMTSLAFALSRALGRALLPGDEVVITQLDHEANRGPWKALEERGAVLREVDLRPDGTLDPEDFVRKVTPRTRLIAVGYASNLLGTVNNLALARMLARDAGAWLLVDAVHGAPHFPLDVAALDADFLLCSAYKFYGPHVGILYTRPGLLETLEPERLCTVDQEAPWRIETGTLNHAALAGVKAAIDYLAGFGEGADLRSCLLDAMARIEAREGQVARRYAEQAAALPGLKVWGPPFGSGRRAPTVAITLKGVQPTEAARRLGSLGVLVGDGHFYAQRAAEVLGLAAKGGVIRAGISLYTTDAEVDRLLAGLAGLVPR
jgi:cysteine desulfurase family protein (TIGR01976 family)